MTARASRFAGLRRRVAERLKWVNALTEREVLATGSSIGEIVSRATGHVGWLREVLARIAGDDHGIHRALAAQAEMVRGHVVDIRTRIATHDACAQQAVEQVANTIAAAQVIEKLARQAKLLALNARIESVRGGERARGFAVIAEEMTRLSSAVAATNDTVQQLAGSLGVLLPKMAQQAHELSERAEAFSGDAARQLGELDRQVAALRTDVASTASASDEAMAKVIEASHAALSHLQFQDVAAQRVLHIDGWLREEQLADGDAPDVVAESIAGGSVDDDPPLAPGSVVAL